MTDDVKKQRIAELKKLIDAFCDRHLKEAYRGYVHTLCDRLGRKRKIDITKGKPEIWAASIIYVIFLIPKRRRSAARQSRLKMPAIFASRNRDFVPRS